MDTTPDPNDPNQMTASATDHAVMPEEQRDQYKDLRAKYDHCKRANKEQHKIICWLKDKLRKY